LSYHWPRQVAAGYNGTIAPGASIIDGFQGTWTSSFKVNGTTCTY
jgi:hypothetical protein